MFAIIALVLATLAFVFSPVLTEPFTGYAPGGFPVPQPDPAVQPAGYAFAIWGVIYIWLAVLAAAAFKLRRDAADWQHAALPLAVSLGPGAVWLWLAGFSPLGATALIYWMLGTALWTLMRAPARDRWLFLAPVGLYAGWLTAAAHVSLGVVLGGYGVLGTTASAIASIALALAVALAVLARRPQAVEYGVAVVWALIGIVVANAGANTAVVTVAVAGMAIVAGVVLRSLRTGRARAA